MDFKDKLKKVLAEYKSLGIAEQIDYDKFYLYSLITHSTAIEGSTVTEIENQLLFDEGISAKGRTMQEQLMNLDLKKAYEYSIHMAKDHTDFSIDMLKGLSAIVMKNTGSTYNTALGQFDASKGDLRLINVTAGAGGRSYMNYQKVPERPEAFCQEMNERRRALTDSDDVISQYNYRQSQKGGHKTERVDRKGGQKNSVEREQRKLAFILPSGRVLSKTSESILDLIRQNEKISSTKMAETLGINRSAVTKHLKKCKMPVSFIAKDRIREDVG